MELNFYKAASLLLDYPESALIEHLDAIAARVDATPGFSAAERQGIRDLLEHLRRAPLTELQADYVRTFDLSAEHSLHLTHHLFGEDKNRGPALIDLSTMYREYGLQQASNELPDYLPLVLEFASGLDDADARRFLADVNKVLSQLAGNLEQAGSVYAPLLRLLENRGGLVELAA
jgi:nitrate reductase delta subunit